MSHIQHDADTEGRRPVFLSDPEESLDAGHATVVLIHGAGMDRRVWDELAVGFRREGLQVVAPDLPGHGRTEGPALDSIVAMAAWIDGLIDTRLELARPFVVGHSMGALVALELAARRAEGGARRLAGLGLLGCAAEMPVNDALLAAAREEPAKAAAMIEKWGLAKKASGEAAEATRALLSAARPEVLHSDLAACNAYTRGGEAAAVVEAPSVVIAGAEDRMTPASSGRALGEALAGGRVAVIPDAGHMMMLEAPRETLSALLALTSA